MSRLQVDCRLHYPSGFELNAKFEAGDGVTALFGPSGSGKSTVFALIAGIQRPEGGTIRLGDRTLVDTRTGVFLPPEERRIGVVFQDHLLFPHLTVEQNLRFGLGRTGARTIDLGRVAQVLEIGELLPRSPDSLSGGQKQRVALGRAILRGPELLLMDEPLTALDEELKDRVLTYLDRAVAEWRIPTLFVSHDQTDVRRLAEHVVVIESGKVIDAGRTRSTLDRAVLTKLRQRPNLVNLLRVTDLQQTDGHWVGRIGEQSLRLPGIARPGPGTSCFVHFLPQDVMLSGKAIGDISARNHLLGAVREVVTLPDRTFVAVDVGQFLWAEVTPEAARELNVEPGAAITCHIKTSALQFLS
jgi:molybdate transport system ATP-binding protein